MLDLAALKPSDASAVLTPTHPGTGAPLPIKIHLLSTDCDAHQQKAHTLFDQRAKAQRANLKRGTPIASVIDESCVLLGTVTQKWEGVEWEGKPVECTPDAAANLYRKLPWLREQVQAFVDERGNFLGN